MPQPMIMPRQPSLLDRMLPIIQQMALMKFQQKMSQGEVERREKLANIKLNRAKEWDLMLGGYKEAEDGKPDVKVGEKGYVRPKYSHGNTVQMGGKMFAQELLNGKPTGKLLDVTGKLPTYQRKTRIEVVGDTEIKIDYDYDPVTGKEIYRRTYFTGKKPSKDQVGKFKAMLAESSPEMRKKYTGKMAQWLIDKKRAGAPTMTQMIGAERFGIQKGATTGELRDALIAGRGNKNTFESTAFQYNNVNPKNEVAYWDSEGKGVFTVKGTKMIKLPAKMVAKGLTPRKVQEQAKTEGKTVEVVLRDLGIIE